MIDAVVVLHDSADVVEPCLSSLREAAPRRGLRLHVVDNASHDDGPDRAQRWATEPVLRMRDNRGFAAGVNAVLRHFAGDWLAVINPDVVVPRGALDRLVDAIEEHPGTGVAGPRARLASGRIEPTVGYFPSLDIERRHALFLDRLGGRTRMRETIGHNASTVDWVSACAWVLAGEAVRSIGPLDEDYFMYYEDVDYCKRLHQKGYRVLFVPDVEVEHRRGRGSARTIDLPADGGRALFHYFGKFHPEVMPERLERTVTRGWRLRLTLHRTAAWLGRRDSEVLARRYDAALRGLEAVKA